MIINAFTDDEFAARSRADQKMIDSRRDGSAPPPHGHNAPQVMTPPAAAQPVSLMDCLSLRLHL
jgi:hypothetical protein